MPLADVLRESHATSALTASASVDDVRAVVGGAGFPASGHVRTVGGKGVRRLPCKMLRAFCPVNPELAVSAR